METLTFTEIEQSVEILAACGRVRKWVCNIYHVRDCSPETVKVSYCSYLDHEGLEKKGTLIFLLDKLPSYPIIKIPKQVTEVTIVDILHLYKDINCIKHLNFN